MTRSRSVRVGAPYLVLAAFAYVPLWFAKTGRVAADTRPTIFLAPDRFVTEALNLYDPLAHLGTITHQNIGLVFPMGLWFWVFEHLGFPVWLAQRLWLGSILFAAGAGVLWLARTWNWRGWGPIVAAFAYAFSPYVLQYAPRTSVLLLPFAGLPWLIALTDRAIRTRSWKHPAAFALVVLCVGSVNATSLALVLLGPLLYAIGLAAITRDAAWRPTIAAFARCGLLSVAVSVYWIAALLIQRRYGLPILSYSETVNQVATTPAATEVLRGLGYWLFYGTEALEPNIEAATPYLTTPGIMVVSFLLPGLALLGALVVRWKWRAWAVAMVCVGTLLSVGAYPLNGQSIFGRVFSTLANSSSFGLALRSSSRAAPLVVLGLALLLGAAVAAVVPLIPRVGSVLAIGAIVLVLVNQPALFNGTFVDRNYNRPEAIPQYWRDAARDLDRRGPDTRVLEIPGSQFAAYRWGTTYEPITPGLMRRPVVAREQIPYGSPASADLVIALDRRMQEGVFEPAAIPAVARLLSASDVLLRSDLAYERYLSPRPRQLWRALTAQPVAGLGPVRSFGEPVENRAKPTLPLVDEQALGLPPAAVDPPPVAVFPVTDAPPIVRAVTTERPTLLDGDGDGVVDAATVGLVPADRLLLYGATLEQNPALAPEQFAAGADLVVTDTNRRRDRRWRSTRNNAGITEAAGQSQPKTDQGEAELVVFPDTTDATRTVTKARGATVTASAYGSPTTFDNDVRAASAFDGDPETAWLVGAIVDPVGTELSITADAPITTDQIALVAPQQGVVTRYVSRVRLTFDGRDAQDFDLSADTRGPAGATVRFPSRTFSKLTIEVLATDTTPDAASRGVSPTGFAEVQIPGLQYEELVRLPTYLTTASTGRSNEHRLVYVLTRQRANPAEPIRNDEERIVARTFTVPDARTFSLTGNARLSARATDATIDRLTGVAPASPDAIVARASGRLPGALDQRSSAAVDGDPATRWSGAFLQLEGTTLAYALPAPVTFDRLDLQVVADGRHSIPTQLRIEAGGQRRDVTLPAIPDRANAAGLASVPISFPSLTGDDVTVTVTGVRAVDTIDYYSQRPIPLPIAIAELGIPGVRMPAGSAAIDTGCRSDLVRVDDQPIPVRVAGTTSAALERQPLRVELCGAPLQLAAGEHTVTTTLGRDSGIDFDRLVLGSERGGGALPITADGNPAPIPAAPTPASVRVTGSDATSYDLRVTDASAPFWLVIGQSQSDAWKLSGVSGLTNPSLLVNGYANGWRVTPNATEFSLQASWTPRTELRVGIAISLLAALTCCVLLVVGRKRRFVIPDSSDDSGAPRVASDLSTRPALGRGSAVAVVTTAGIVAALVASWWLGILVAAIAAAAVGAPRGRWLLIGTAAASLAGAFLWVVGSQVRTERALNYAWTNGFATPSRIALSALVLVAADVAISVLDARRRARPAP